jgi:hypothetical protein
MYDRFVPELAERLAAAGFLSARDEAEQLRRAAGGDDRLLASLAERRLAGEPLAWIVGGTEFCGLLGAGRAGRLHARAAHRGTGAARRRAAAGRRGVR